MLQKFMKITPNLERAENTKNAEKQKKTSFPKEQAKNTDLYKPALNKIMSKQEYCVKYNFVSFLKLTEELCVMTMKNDAKFEEELTCRLKIQMRNFTI